MTDQNSAVEYQIRPDDLMEELGIKKDAYYAYVKFLDIKVGKADGKAFLSQEQANLMRSLRSHIVKTGKMEGFSNTNGGELAIAEESNLFASTKQEATQEIPLEDEAELQRLFRAAAELKGQRLVMPQMVVSELADRISYDDLPDDVKQKVDRARETTSPKHPSQLAADLLNRYRAQKIAATA